MCCIYRLLIRCVKYWLQLIVLTLKTDQRNNDSNEIALSREGTAGGFGIRGLQGRGAYKKSVGRGDGIYGSLIVRGRLKTVKISVVKACITLT